MSEIKLHLVVNGVPVTVQAEPCLTLLDILRDKLGLTGTKDGCGAGDCGACVVLMDGQAVNACLVLAAQAEGAQVITVEGLALAGDLHPLQQAFADKWALQCGFCTPGMLMSCYALLLNNPNPTPEEIREAIAGNLCRCGTYQSVVEATLAASRSTRETRHG
jgi:aerobic-type carbon monoxide dehydrogenase small subunit (CoxS/CutS family)